MQKDHENFERRQALKRRRIDKPLESADNDDTRLTDLSTTEPHLGSLRDIDAVVFERSMKRYDIQQEKQQNSDLRAEVVQLRGEVNTLQKLQQEAKSQLSIKEDVLKNDDKKVKYYTGLPSYALLKVAFDFVCENIPKAIPISSCKLSPFKQFIMTLMKLRHNFGDTDLAYHFNVDKSTVSRYFSKWLELLYVKLSFMILWPDRDDLLKTMPLEFRRHFRQCVIIIDCFEIFIERPTALLPRAQT